MSLDSARCNVDAMNHFSNLFRRHGAKSHYGVAVVAEIRAKPFNAVLSRMSTSFVPHSRIPAATGSTLDNYILALRVACGRASTEASGATADAMMRQFSRTLLHCNLPNRHWHKMPSPTYS